MTPRSRGPARYAVGGEFVWLFVGVVGSAWLLAWTTARALPTTWRSEMPDTATTAWDTDESPEADVAREDARRRREAWERTPEGQRAKAATAQWLERFRVDSIAGRDSLWRPR